jgi:hypothetical protein
MCDEEAQSHGAYVYQPRDVEQPPRVLLPQPVVVPPAPAATHRVARVLVLGVTARRVL